jgi:hypothetical protein
MTHESHAKFLPRPGPSSLPPWRPCQLMVAPAAFSATSATTANSRSSTHLGNLRSSQRLSQEPHDSTINILWPSASGYLVPKRANSSLTSRKGGWHIEKAFWALESDNDDSQGFSDCPIISDEPVCKDCSSKLLQTNPARWWPFEGIMTKCLIAEITLWASVRGAGKKT